MEKANAQEKKAGDAVITVPAVVQEEIEPKQMDKRIQPLVDEFKAKTDANMVWAKALTVINQGQLEAASEEIAKIKKGSKVIDQTRKFFVEDLTQYIAKVNAVFKPIKDALDSAEKVAKAVCTEFLTEQDRVRREDQERKDRETAKVQRLHKTLAVKALANGDTEKAQEQVEKAHAVETDVVAAKAEAPEKTHLTGRWVGEVTDLKKFIKGIADGIIPLDPDMIEIKKGKLNEKARALKDTVQWPGVRFYEDIDMTFRTKDPETKE